MLKPNFDLPKVKQRYLQIAKDAKPCVLCGSTFASFHLNRVVCDGCCYDVIEWLSRRRMKADRVFVAAADLTEEQITAFVLKRFEDECRGRDRGHYGVCEVLRWDGYQCHHKHYTERRGGGGYRSVCKEHRRGGNVYIPLEPPYLDQHMRSMVNFVLFACKRSPCVRHAFEIIQRDNLLDSVSAVI